MDAQKAGLVIGCGSLALDLHADFLLDEKRVAVVPALAFGDDNYVRLSYAVSRQSIVDGMARIKEFVGELEG